MQVSLENLPRLQHPCRIQRFINHRSRRRLHWHEEIEILYFIKGEGHVVCNLQECPVRAGDLVLVNGKELHTGCISGEASYYCLHINTDFFHNLVGEEYVIFRSVITDPECAVLLDRVIAESEKADFAATVRVKAALYQLFALLSARHVAEVLEGDVYRRRFHRLDTFNEVVEYIDSHYAESMSVAELSERFYLSPSYFAHVFKARTGKGIIEYVNDLRISHARSLLVGEALSVAEIAHRVGFPDGNYFSRKFKEVTGQTPLAYRKSNQ